MPFDLGFDFSFGDPVVDPSQKESQDVFGVDIFFDGDYSITPKGDYREITGIENLRRAILRRLVTAPGEYRLNPAYGVGVGQFVKKRITKAVTDELRHRILDNLSRERRISKVLEVTVTPKFFGNSTGVEIFVKIESIGKTIALRPFTFTRSV